MLLPILVVKARNQNFASTFTGRVDEFVVIDVDANVRVRLLIGIEKQ